MRKIVLAPPPPMIVMNSRRLTASASRASDRKDNTPQLRQETAALRDFVLAYDRCGSCVTSIASPNGGAQLYER